MIENSLVGTVLRRVSAKSRQSCGFKQASQALQAGIAAFGQLDAVEFAFLDPLEISLGLEKAGSPQLASDPRGLYLFAIQMQGWVIDESAALLGAEKTTPKTTPQRRLPEQVYVHIQKEPLQEWSIQHGLGDCPRFEVLDFSGTQLWPDISQVSPNVATAWFTQPVAGRAVCRLQPAASLIPEIRFGGSVLGPSWDLVSVDDKIAGTRFTWGDATNGGSRIPKTQQIMNGIATMATELENIFAYFAVDDFEINSWHRKSSLEPAFYCAADLYLQGLAVDFYSSKIAEIYQGLSGVWPGGLAFRPGLFLHLDARHLAE